MGEVKHSSVGMLGLKKMPWRLVSPPPQNCPSGMRPTVRSVPLALLYFSWRMCRLLRYWQRSCRSLLWASQAATGSSSTRLVARMASHSFSIA